MMEPLRVPMPPTTSITIMLNVMANEKELGVNAVTRCAQSAPAAPAKKAPIVKASSLVEKTRTPRADADISSSRIAIMARP